MSTNGHYDLIIIGTGAGGGTPAYKLAPSGQRILLIERGPGAAVFSFERGGESRAHRHRQRLAFRRSSAGPSELKKYDDATVRLLSANERKNQAPIRTNRSVISMKRYVFAHSNPF
ncbi:MAG: NAD(P)-binding protein [Terrimicrobiaceae bacterium]